MGISPEEFKRNSASTIVSDATKTDDFITTVHVLIHTAKNINIGLMSDELSDNRRIKKASAISQSLMDKVIEPLEAIRDGKKPKGADKIEKSLQEIRGKIDGLDSTESGRKALESLDLVIKEVEKKEGFWDWVAQQKGKSSFLGF